MGETVVPAKPESRGTAVRTRRTRPTTIAFPAIAICAVALAPAAFTRASERPAALFDAPPAGAQDAPWPTSGWSTSTPAAEGLDPAPFAELRREIADGGYGYIDRLVVVRNGFLVVNERYDNDYREISRDRHTDASDALAGGGTPHQFNYYHPDFHPYHQGRDVHSLQSVTKSVSSTLIGIAIGRGEISGTDAKLLSFFEGYDTSGADSRLADVTLDDLLTMRSGIEWHENDRPFNETNTVLQLEGSEDWIQFTLDQPMDADPGVKWVYNSGGSHLMSGVIKAATGSFIDEYAVTHLFEPIGIRDHHWKKTPRGYPDTEGGLYLEAEDLARFGYLFLRGGMWDGSQVVPREWVEAATARRVDRVNPAGFGYGYQWWRLDRDGVDVWAGLGFGGQFLLVIPEYDLVGVVNSWNVFGGQRRNIVMPFLEALLASVSEPDR
jgi:CubicO group peptidase (beta-lactamase class C family)